MAFSKRTIQCGEVSDGQIGQQVTLNGWVNRNRDQGGIAFIDLRDRTGVVQVTIDGGVVPEALEIANRLRSEYSISVVAS